MARELTGRIFNIQRYCAGDGPGIRTTVFFQDLTNNGHITPLQEMHLAEDN